MTDVAFWWKLTWQQHGRINGQKPGCCKKEAFHSGSLVLLYRVLFFYICLLVCVSLGCETKTRQLLGWFFLCFFFFCSLVSWSPTLSVKQSIKVVSLSALGDICSFALVFFFVKWRDQCVRSALKQQRKYTVWSSTPRKHLLFYSKGASRLYTFFCICICERGWSVKKRLKRASTWENIIIWRLVFCWRTHLLSTSTFVF